MSASLEIRRLTPEKISHCQDFVALNGPQVSEEGLVVQEVLPSPWHLPGVDLWQDPKRPDILNADRSLAPKIDAIPNVPQ